MDEMGERRKLMENHVLCVSSNSIQFDFYLKR